MVVAGREDPKLNCRRKNNSVGSEYGSRFTAITSTTLKIASDAPRVGARTATATMRPLGFRAKAVTAAFSTRLGTSRYPSAHISYYRSMCGPGLHQRRLLGKCWSLVMYL